MQNQRCSLHKGWVLIIGLNALTGLFYRGTSRLQWEGISNVPVSCKQRCLITDSLLVTIWKVFVHKVEEIIPFDSHVPYRWCRWANKDNTFFVTQFRKFWFLWQKSIAWVYSLQKIDGTLKWFFKHSFTQSVFSEKLKFRSQHTNCMTFMITSSVVLSRN